MKEPATFEEMMDDTDVVEIFVIDGGMRKALKLKKRLFRGEDFTKCAIEYDYVFLGLDGQIVAILPLKHCTPIHGTAQTTVAVEYDTPVVIKIGKREIKLSREDAIDLADKLCRKLNYSPSPWTITTYPYSGTVWTEFVGDYPNTCGNTAITVT